MTGSYQVENLRASKVRWPHLVQCDFPLAAKDDLVDLLIEVDYADLRYLFVDIRGNVGEPVASLRPLGWTCIRPPVAPSGAGTHTIRMLLTKGTGPMSETGGCCELGNTQAFLGDKELWDRIKR